jgi:hypothetical protein
MDHIHPKNWERHGYASRDACIKALAENYGVSTEAVEMTAKFLSSAGHDQYKEPPIL